MDSLQSAGAESLSLENKVAYLKGVCSTLPADKEHGEVMLSVVQLMSEMTDVMTQLQRKVEEIEQYLDDVDDDLANLEEFVFEQDGSSAMTMDESHLSMQVSFADIVCPSCGEHFFLDEDFWAHETEVNLPCPNCQEPVTVGKIGTELSH